MEALLGEVSLNKQEKESIFENITPIKVINTKIESNEQIQNTQEDNIEIQSQPKQFNIYDYFKISDKTKLDNTTLQHLDEIYNYVNDEAFPVEAIPVMLKTIENKMGKSQDITNRINKVYRYILGLQRSELSKEQQLELMDDESVKNVLEEEAKETGNFNQFLIFCANLERLRKEVDDAKI